MDEITSGDSGQVAAWLDARGVGDSVALYAIDEATRCDLGPECPDGCGGLDDYTVTSDAGAGTWTARSSTGRRPLDTWTVFASSGEHSYAALAIAAHETKHPGDFVQVVINDAYPASVIIANLTASE